MTAIFSRIFHDRGNPVVIPTINVSMLPWTTANLWWLFVVQDPSLTAIGHWWEDDLIPYGIFSSEMSCAYQIPDSSLNTFSMYTFIK